MSKGKSFWDEAAERWPSSVVARTEIGKFTGGAMSEKYIANLDSLGEGPSVRLRTGRKVLYPVIPLTQWLSERSKEVFSKRRAGVDYD